MNQQQLINEIASHVSNTGTSKASIKFVLDAQASIAQLELKKGGEVTLPGIGKLSVKQRAARMGRNPKTGETMEISAKKVPHFAVAKALKDSVN